MYPCEIAGIQYVAPLLPPSYRPHVDFASFDFCNIFAPPSQPQDMTTMTIPRVSEAMFVGSRNSTCDQKQKRAADERRKKRTISNRESARRSRTRKRRQLDEMQLQVAGLHAANCRLLGDLSRVARDCDRVLHENARLREEGTELRKKLEKVEGAKELGDADASAKLKDQQTSLQ